jgi:hypothetical protein
MRVEIEKQSASQSILAAQGLGINKRTEACGDVPSPNAGFGRERYFMFHWIQPFGVSDCRTFGIMPTLRNNLYKVDRPIPRTSAAFF